MSWNVYIIEASDTSLYTGITTDVQRRFAEHLRIHKDGSGPGAKYFYARAPKKLMYVESGHDRSSASIREAEIKKMHRKDKLLLISSAPIPADT